MPWPPPEALFIVFAFSSWSNLNALWLELPEMYKTAPEGYALATYMLAALALTNLAPLGLALAEERRERRSAGQRGAAAAAIPLRPAIAGLVSLAVVLAALLGALWAERTTVGGRRRSVALLALVALCGVANNTTTVTFWPWCGRQATKWTWWLGVGEGVSGMITGAMAVVQGAGAERPLFGASAYFYALAALNAASLAAFVALCRLEDAGALGAGGGAAGAGAGGGGGALAAERGEEGAPAGRGGGGEGGALAAERGDEAAGERAAAEDAAGLEGVPLLVGAGAKGGGWSAPAACCGAQCWLSFCQFGLVQSVNSYATGGYAAPATVLLWATVGAFLGDPAGRCLAGRAGGRGVARSGVRGLAAPLVAFTASVAWIVVAAKAPPLRGHGGAVLLVLANVAAAALYGYLNTSVYLVGRAAVEQAAGARGVERFYRRAAAALQLGSFLGAAASFLLVIVLRAFG